uniref:ARAD1D07590p n=1 Tax=Blastobotrys adeninivorans TaxID=409370 RepID=A0A060TEH8_BLAAD
MKNCVVTGGSKGIGLAIAKRFAKECHVTLVARNIKSLEEALGTLPNPEHHSVHECNVADEHAIYDLGRAFRGKKVDYLINSAGITQSSLLLGMKPKVLHSIIDTNLNGTILSTQALLRPIMSAQGSILNISSVLASRGLPGTSVYAASKAGVEAFTRSISSELRSRKVRANCLALGLVDTDMGKSVSQEVHDHFINSTFGRLLTVDEVADAAYAVATNEAFSGAIVPLDGGYV